MNTNVLTYAESGVNVDLNKVWTERIGCMVDEDRRHHGIMHVSPIGGFAGALKIPPQIVTRIVAQFDLSEPDALVKALSSFSIVACTDGVGTKTMIAEKLSRLETLGYDLLAMNVNDLVVSGATPVAFLDYIGCKGIVQNNEFRYMPFVKGLIEACREINVELVGGETAEMRDNYTEFGSDLTGFAIGILLENEVPPVQSIEPDDVILALRSSGLHSNGYSLVRKIIDNHNISYDDKPQELGGQSVADAVLMPTRLYVNQALKANMSGVVKAMAHITGGGLLENLERALPKGKELKIELFDKVFDPKKTLPVFNWIRSFGVAEAEMLKTFNMGYGFAFITNEKSWPKLEESVGEDLILIGRVTA